MAWPKSWKPRPCLFSGFSLVIVFVGFLVFALWFGVNSDRDNVPPLLTQLIPAGHCTCSSATVFQCSECLNHESTIPHALTPGNWTYSFDRDNANIGLDEQQCDAAFPGLYNDLLRARRFWLSRGGVTSHMLDQIPLEPGMARVTIHNGELHVRAARARGEDHRRKILATLSTMYRALVAWQPRSDIPEIDFVFSVEDKAEDIVSSGHPLWVLARKASETSLWLIPDFGFWAWDSPDTDNHIGPYSEVVDHISQKGAGTLDNWDSKIQKIVWRGKLSFAPKLRRTLIDVTRNQAWADIRPMDWRTKEDFISMENHCKYAFIAHVEGRSYSAALKYRQACRSVIVAHKMQWIQHHHFLLVDSGPLQNYVEVERDFSDLQSKMEELIQNPTLAKRIADNNVDTFRERYLTQAAEACYWRKLWSSWATVYEREERSVARESYGLRYESFLLLDSSNMMNLRA